MQKSDGGYPYATSDLAAIRDRAGRVGATRALYVVGQPQSRHFAMVFATARAAGWLGQVRCEHVPFGNVLGDDRKPLRTRSGSTLVPEEQAQVARAIGIGALKYADLSNDRAGDYVFSFDRMLAFEGNTGPYLQYANARIRSILGKAGAAEGTPSGPISLGEPKERALAVALLGFPKGVTDALETLEPHRLCSALHAIAQAYAAFYEACPVLRADVPEDVRASRLALSWATASTLAAGLSLLGIEAPDRM